MPPHNLMLGLDLTYEVAGQVRRDVWTTHRVFTEPVRDWTHHDVLAALRRRHKERLAMNAGAVNREYVALAPQAVQQLGSRDAALMAAGVDPGRARLRHVCRPADLPSAIRDRHDRGGAMSRVASAKDEPVLVDAVRRGLGLTCSDTLALAGVGTDDQCRTTIGAPRRLSGPARRRRHPRAKA